MDDIPVDYIRLKPLKFSLDGMALAWFKSLAPRSTFLWEAMFDVFMTKYFPPSKTKALRMKITSFNILPDETFTAYWERFKKLLMQCPTHGQPGYVLIQIFY